MISKLPDPDQWSKSPLENALKDPDPIFKEPAFRQLVVSLHGRDPKGVLASLRTLAAKFPDKPALQFLHGAFALSLKLYPEAETSFRKLIATKAEAAGGWFGLAEVQVAQDRASLAVASLHRAVALQPKFTLAWFTLAVLRGEVEPTRLWGQRGAAGDAARPRAAPGMGHAGLLRAEHEKVRRGDHRLPARPSAFPTAIPSPTRASASATRRPTGPPTPSRRSRSALVLAPKNYHAATALGACYLRAGQPADGVKVCRQAVEAKPDFSEGWDVLGVCYRQQGKTREASDAFQRALKADPANVAARTHLAEAASKARR